MDARRVSLFRNGLSQTLGIPHDMELPGDEAILRKEGNRLIIEPAPTISLLALLATWEPIEEDFDFGENLPADPVDL